MWQGFRRAGRFGCALLLGLSLPVEAAAEPVVTGARIGVNAGKTRFVVDLSERVAFQAFTLANPYRVVVDLPPVRWRMKPTPVTRGGLIGDFRYGAFRADIARIVLDLRAPARIVKAFLLDPRGRQGHRLVIDLKRVSAAAFRPGAPSHGARRPPAAATAPKRAAGPRRAGAKRVVAVDPGHGGVDPGAIGRSGVHEKRVVLAQARVLRRTLEASGRYRVMLTRDRDVYVRLRGRIARARRAGAELFISLHADSIHKPRVRGASIYTLSERASDREAAALAARENKADVIAGVDLGVQNREVADILIDLAQRETKNESAIFAAHLVRELGKVTRMLRRRPHRFAGFAVLKAPDMPSVLVELGYLSNRADEKLLRSGKHRAKVAVAILRAIDAYFARQQALNRP